MAELPSSPIATVIVSTRNRPNEMRRAAASIGSNKGLDFGLVVADRSDGDHTERVLEPILASPRLRYNRTPVMGERKVVNREVELTNSPYLLFTEEACEVPSDWVHTMVSALHADPKVGAVFCRVVAGPEAQEIGVTREFMPEEEKRWVRSWRRTQPGSGAGLAVRREALMDVGGFDEAMGPGGRFPGAADADLGFRLLRSGWHVVDIPSVEVVNHGHAAVDDPTAVMADEWVSIGAYCGKALRCGALGIIPTITSMSWGALFRDPLLGAVRSRRAMRGIQRFSYFWVGFSAGLFAEVDTEDIVFEA